MVPPFFSADRAHYPSEEAAAALPYTQLKVGQRQDKSLSSAQQGFPSCRTWTTTHTQSTSLWFASQQSEDREPHHRRWEVPPLLLLAVGPDLHCWQWHMVQKLFEQRGNTAPSLTGHTAPTGLTQLNTWLSWEMRLQRKVEKNEDSSSKYTLQVLTTPL